MSLSGRFVECSAWFCGGIYADPESIMERGIAREITDGKRYNRLIDAGAVLQNAVIDIILIQSDCIGLISSQKPSKKEKSLILSITNGPSSRSGA